MRQAVVISIVLLCFSCKSHKREASDFAEGGYPYAKKLTLGDDRFYHHPMKKVIEKRDSIIAAFYGPQFYPAFNEPNLSLSPPKTPIIRFIYEDGYMGYTALIRVQEGQMIVKEKLTGFPISYPDEANLDSVERLHFRLLEMNYPLKEYKGSPFMKRRYDSLANAFPQLNDPRYFLSLMNRAKQMPNEPFSYRKWTVTLDDRKYQNLMESINSSEFWHLPFQDDRCLGEVMDAAGYSLEIAAPDQYKMVITTPCNEPTEFQRVCLQLMKLSGLEANLKKYNQDAIKKAHERAKNGS